MKVNYKRLHNAIEKFSGVQAIVIGDVMLDVFLWGTVSRISPEAPVPIVDVKKETYHLGGAANVAHNISALGGRVILCGRVGQDIAGIEIFKLLEEKGIDSRGIAVCPDCPTTVKTRIIAHSQQVVRFDKEVKTPLNNEAWRRIKDFIGSIGKCDIIVVSDYAKGVITEELMDEVRKLSERTGKPLIVDPKVSNKKLYFNATVLTPNYSEALQMAGYNSVDSNVDLNGIALNLMEELRCHYLLVTRGSEGMTLFERNKAPLHIPAYARKVFDVTGAGDTVVAVLALGMATGLPVQEAVFMANLAAGFVVGEVGTAVIGPDQLKLLIMEEMRRS